MGDPNISITSIEFKTKDNLESSLAYVKVNYSDGQTKEFQNGDAKTNKEHEIISFDADVPIRAVIAKSIDYYGGKVGGIGFLDEQDNIVSYYDPFEWTYAAATP